MTNFRFAELVGTYRLAVSDELLAFIERTFVEPAEPSRRDEIRAAARAEAEGAEIEIRVDGTFVSRSGAEEFYRVQLAVDEASHASISFEKAPGQLVTLSLKDSSTVIADQPGRPPAEFRRT